MNTNPQQHSEAPKYPSHKRLTAAQTALLAGVMGLTASCEQQCQLYTTGGVIIVEPYKESILKTADQKKAKQEDKTEPKE